MTNYITQKEILEAYKLAEKITAAGDARNMHDCIRLINLMDRNPELGSEDCMDDIIRRAINDANTLYAWEASGAAMDLAGRV